MSDHQVITYLLEIVNKRRKNPLNIEIIRQRIINPDSDPKNSIKKSKTPRKSTISISAILEYLLNKYQLDLDEVKVEVKHTLSELQEGEEVDN
jgi:hypothetical protein